MVVTSIRNFVVRGKEFRDALFAAVEGVEPLRLGAALGPFLSIERVGDDLHVRWGVNFSQARAGDAEIWWPVGKTLSFGAVVGDSKPA